MKILAIDPGLASGWAVVELQPDYTAKVLTSGADAPDRMGEIIEGWAESPGVQHIVMESFTISLETTKKSFQPFSLELIGVGKYFAHKNGIGFHLQSPGDAKALTPDKKLRELGIWVSSDHTRDALRHAVLFLVKRGLKVTAKVPNHHD